MKKLLLQRHNGHSEEESLSFLKKMLYSESLKKTGLPCSRWSLAMTGFTLAEVLITLSILGLVAAISIPNLIRNYQRRATVVKVKKMYSMLDHAYNMYLIENEPKFFFRTVQDSTEAFNKIIKPYFQITYDAGTNTINKKKILGSPNYYNLDGVNGRYDFSSAPEIYAVKLKNNDVIMIRGYYGEEKNVNETSIRFQVLYDINGKEGPNLYGKDLFSFNARGRNLVAGLDRTIQDGARGCIENLDGISCAAWIILKGNMNYLDCPGNLDYDTGKCK